jgi:CRISPR-associated protein Cas2
MYIVLVYDVSQEENGARRWSRIFKICKKYLTHIQNSVFEGELTVAKLNKLKSELSKWIDKDLDSIIIFKSRSNKWLIKEFWGMDTSADTSNFF